MVTYGLNPTERLKALRAKNGKIMPNTEHKESAHNK